MHAIGTWWTILAHDDRPEPVDVTVWRNRLRAGGAGARAEVPSIDVFVTAYGEGPELVRTTMRAARDMELPHKVFVLDDLPLSEVASQGYCFQVDLAWRAWKAGYDLVEVPITFVERERGASKMNRAIVFEALWRVTWWGLRARRPRAAAPVRTGG